VGQFEDALLFKSIVDYQSLAKAAHHLGLNAPTVSKRLAKLESALGTQLLNRTTRRLSLTEEGHYFYEKVTRLEYEWQSAVDETTSLGKEVKGSLKIAAPQTLLSRFLMPLLASFNTRYPQINLELIHQPIENLPLINADISISREITGYDSNMVMVSPFYYYHNRLFASPEYLEKNSQIDEPNQLREHTCLVYAANYSPLYWEFKDEKIPLGRVMVMNNAETMISAAKSGLGIVYLPVEILQEELKQKQLTPILPKLRSQQYKTCAYYPKTTFVPQKVRLLLDFLKSQYVAECYADLGIEVN
jgi:DNA-binding transcriptional LysR family regulator